MKQGTCQIPKIVKNKDRINEKKTRNKSRTLQKRENVHTNEIGQGHNKPRLEYWNHRFPL